MSNEIEQLEKYLKQGAVLLAELRKGESAKKAKVVDHVSRQSITLSIEMVDGVPHVAGFPIDAIIDPNSLAPHDRLYFPELDTHGPEVSYRQRYLRLKDRNAESFRDGYAFASVEAADAAAHFMAHVFARVAHWRETQ